MPQQGNTSDHAAMQTYGPVRTFSFHAAKLSVVPPPLLFAYPPPPPSVSSFSHVNLVCLLLLLGLEPVGRRGGGGLGAVGGVLALDLHGHALVLLQVAGEVGLLGRVRGLGEGEGLDLALGVRFLDGWDLVGLELLEVEILDEVGCEGRELA